MWLKSVFSFYVTWYYIRDGILFCESYNYVVLKQPKWQAQPGD